MTHEEALELSGLYALDVLTPDEKAEVDAHIAVCALDHSEFAELGGVAPALASLVEPAGAPAALKRRVLESYRADVVVPASRSSASSTTSARRSSVPNWMGWAAAGVALVLIAILGVVSVNLRSQADLANQKAAQMQQAIAAMSAPGSQVAILKGSGAASDVSGFVAVPAGGTGYMVMTNVPAVPSGMTYQGWYIANGTPVSAGLMEADSNGTVVASGLQPVPGTSVVAVTVEPDGGSKQPTSQPIIVGNLSTNS
jgi:anti-sigma-K factor RskA